MKIYQCDICKKKVSYLDTMVIYRRSFDYCNDCKKQVEKIKQEFLSEVEFQNVMFDSKLRTKEVNLLGKIKRTNNNGIGVKE